MINRAKQTADEYRHLGGRRLAAFDDNKASTRAWDKNNAGSRAFLADEDCDPPG